HLAFADDHADVSGVGGGGAGSGVEEHQVTGLFLSFGDAGAVAPLGAGHARDVDSGGAVGGVGQAGAVVGAGPGGAPHVRFAELGAGERDRLRCGLAGRQGGREGVGAACLVGLLWGFLAVGAGLCEDLVHVGV